MLTTYIVNSTSPGAGGPGVTTLSAAIALANADTTDSNPFVINFDIPTSDSGYNATTGVWTIALIGSGLPIVTHSVVIDATTQPGYKGQPLIELDGTNATVGAVQGLEFHVGGNTVKGLDIVNSENFGIVLDGTNDPGHNTGPGLNNIIQACYIGTDPTGEIAEPNFGGGIDVINSSYNLIGGLNLASPGGSIPGQLVKGNLISGNGLTGIFLSRQGDTHNYIEGNYIGTDVSGLKALDATNLPAPLKVTDGIFLGPARGDSSDGFASNNLIGDFDPDEMQFDANGRNIIAGQRNGVYILGGTGNQVSGNYIGVGADGATPIPNFEDGVRLEDASSNTIGAAGEGNVISANLYNGVEIVADSASEDGTAVPVPLQISENNLVQANYIGTNAAGTAAVPNGGPIGGGTQGFGDGVLLDSAGTALVANNTIGGNGITTTGNVISGNLGNGVALIGASVQKNLVQGNYIGTDDTGEKPLGNRQTGVYVTGIVGQSGGPAGNIIGSALPGGLGSNVISANVSDGVIIGNGASATHVNGNLIGVDALGGQTDPDGQPNSGDELGNHGNGIRIEQAAGNFVGDALAGGNTIGGNLQSGVLIAGANAQNNTLVRNLIGVGVSNSVYTKLPNDQGGIRVTGALGDGSPSLNTIGGANPGASYVGNVISSNHLDGLEIDGGATLTKILGNFIGTDPTGSTRLGNDANGINIVDSSLNTVGGTSAATRNFIVNNGTNGVVIQGAAAKGNIVSGDYIGIAADGVTAAGNIDDGILVKNSAAGNFIGLESQNGGNAISGNLSNGIHLSSAGAGNTIQNNFIGLNAAGTASLPNEAQLNGVYVDNTPGTVIGAASFSQGGNVISGGVGSGVFVGGIGSVGTQIEGNYIGTDLSATTAIPNEAAGIILAAASDLPAAIGPSTNATVTANTIGGNKLGGIALAFGTNGNTILSNFIGTNAQGANLANTGYGIKIDGSPHNFIGSSTPIASFGNTIANTMASPNDTSTVGSGHGIDITGTKATNNYVWANTISGNAGTGIEIDAGDKGKNGGPTSNTIGGVAGLGNTIIGNNIGVDLDGQGTSNNVVLGNLIGIDKNNSPTANLTGVQIVNGASSNVIGGNAAGAANIISDSTHAGVVIGGNDNTIEGNDIGTDVNGAYQAGFGNKFYGIEISGQNNTVGGATSTPGAAPGNKLYDNGAGVLLTGAGTTQNNLLGNEIASSVRFVDPNVGTVNGNGVDVADSASHNVIGGVNNADANSIYNNVDAGVHVEAGSFGITIEHNRIFGNAGLGILLDPAAGDNQGGNNSQAAPVLNEATTGQSHRLAGWLQGAPNNTYTVEFFTGQYNVFTTSGNEDDDAEHLLIPLPPTTPEVGVNVTPQGVTLTTNAGGVCLFDLQLPGTIAVGTVIRATATDSNGNTSEFSRSVVVATDSDGDGIPDKEENKVSAGNSQNASVASFEDSFNANQFITLQAPAGITFQNVWSVTNPSPNDVTPKYMFGLGFVDFTLSGVSPGQHVAVTMTLPVELGAENKYFRYGPTPDNTSPHWYQWNYDPATDTGAEINGNTVILHFVNGGRGDDDLNANNSTIVDAGGPGFPGPYTVINTADSGPGSLRQAILNADADTVPHVISFDLSGSGPFTIQPLSALPALTNQVTIDGTSQPGYAGTPLVELDGSQAGPGVNGLALNVQGSTVQGLAINRFSGDGLLLNSDGTYSTDSILGDFIGTDVTGTKALANGGFGIEVNDATDVVIGDSLTNERNIISANAAGGIYFHGSNASGNGVENDLIGTQADGVSPLGNGGPGILFDTDADYNAIGPYSSSSKDRGNIIAFNAGPGVQVANAVANHIRANSMFSNGGGGIDLTGIASNNAQSSPVLTSAASQAGATRVTGTFAGPPNEQVTLDFYASTARDRSGVVEGQTFLGSKIMFTDASGNAAFDATLVVSATPGSYVTATATDNVKGTSPFSASLQIPVPPPPTPRVFTVNTTDDVNDAVPDPAHFSLREAIQAANSNPGQDTIDFNLPKGNYVIRPMSALPDITDPVMIDGTSQPGFRGLPLVELDGSQAGQNADGLRITGGGSIVRGLIVHSFQQAGIELAGGGGNTIEGNSLGTDATGTSAMPDPYADVYVNDSPGNLIGGTTAAARNVLTFVHVTGYNQNTGIVDPNAGGNRIEGNYIGTDLTGTALLSGVTARGVTVDTSSGNTIGGTDVGAGNTIAGGVNIFDASSNIVQGNLIGTNGKGTAALAGGAGVNIDGEAFSTAYNQIGGSTPAARNIIAGTVYISGRNGFDNKVEGNYIGTDVTGTVALGNAVGVDITGAYNTIGGADPGAGNLISGNAGAGVLLEPSAHGNTIAGNRIGTDATGTKSLANSGYGVRSNGYENTIGGTAAGAGNLISGNLSGGIALTGGVSGGDVVQGNYVGTDLTGTIALDNGLSNGAYSGDGIYADENYVVIGGTEPGARNVISSNAGNGVSVNVGGLGGYFANGISIAGNYIGTDATGNSPLGNGGDGINIAGSQNDAIGGSFPGSGNLISANGGDGIRIVDPQDYVSLGHASTGNVIQGNTIGADATGTRPMGNAGDGISIITSNYVASDETIGGIAPGAGNLVAFNGGRGVSVPIGNGNSVRGNDIYDNGGLGLITDINGTLSTYAEARGLALPHATPVLTSAVFDPQGTVVSGAFSGAPLTNYGIDLFSNDAVNPSGFGDGQTYLETISVLTDQNGSGEFQIPLDAAVPVGKWLTATATPEQTPPSPPSGPVPIPFPNTSGFSQPVAVVAAVDASDLQFTAPAYIATENGGAAVVTVTRTGSTAGTATVDYAMSDGSAMAGTDYTATKGTLVFNDGETSKTITVPVQDDGVADANKTFQIALANATGASLGSVSQAAVTIADDNQAGQIAFASPTFAADFSLGNPVFTLTRTGGDHGRVTVDFRVTGGTAVPFVMQPGSGNQDYEDNFGTVTFDDGQTTATISFLYVYDLVNGLLTHVYDGPLTIVVTLGNPTGGATLGATTTSVLTLDDEEYLHDAFAASGFFPTSKGVPENAGSAQIEIIRYGQLTTTESVSYATVNGTAKARTNYVATSGTVTFQPGQIEAFVNIPLIPDRVVGNPGDFQVVLSNPTGGSFIFPGLDSVDVPILDSDVPTPQSFGVDNQLFNEDSSVAQVTVSRLGGVSGAAQVHYATSDGTAAAGLDYQTESGTLTFSAGQTSQTFSVPILRHNFVGNETFYVTLSNPTGGATLDPKNPATMTLAGTFGQVQVASASYPVAENNSQLTVTLPLDVTGASHGTATVDYATHDGTAKAGVDYTAVSGTLAFTGAVGTVTIPIKNELVDDGDETFYLTLSNPTDGITLGSPSTTAITILETNPPQQQPTTTTLTSDAPSGSNYGQTVTFTAAVTAGNGAPTGSVDFVDQTTGQDLGTAKLAVVNGVDEASVRATGLTASSHTIVASYTSDTSSFANSDGTLTQAIAPAILTVTADNKSKIYGQANPPLTDTITGFVNGDTASMVSGVATLSTTATTGSGVGNYPITVGLGTLSAANYTFALVNGNLSITPATLTVTADNKTKVYGQANPSLTDTITGFVNGDTASMVSGVANLSTAATTTSGVGNYSIAIGLGTLSAANYTFDFVNGNLSITPATLTVTADNKTMVYGATVPTLTDTITGFVNGDPSSVVSGSANLSTTGTSASDVAAYPITVGLGTLSAANYNFALVNGILTVNPDPTTTSLGAAVFGLSVNFTATVTANAPGSGTPTGSVDFFDTTTQTDLGLVALSGGTASLTATLPDSTQNITVEYQGDTNFLSSSAATTASSLASIYVLNPSVSGALAASGNSQIGVPGVVVDDSSSTTAITANGDVKIAAAQIDVVGGVRATGRSSFSPVPQTGHAVVPDPYRNLVAPSAGTSLGSISLDGKDSLTIHPGVYTKINVSGNAKLTMTSGVYVISGGGFSVSGNASVNGAGVTIYNQAVTDVDEDDDDGHDGSESDDDQRDKGDDRQETGDGGGGESGDGGNGSIDFSGGASISLSAPVTGQYAGVLIFQARDASQPLEFSGNAFGGISGTIYAADAPLRLSGNASLNVPVVVNTLTLSGNAVLGVAVSTGDDDDDDDHQHGENDGGDDDGQRRAQADATLAQASLTPNQIYVVSAYQSAWGAAGTTDTVVAGTSLGAWAANLDAGATRSAFTATLLHSDDYYESIVDGVYQKYLGRSADDAGSAYWVAQLRQGTTDEQLEADFAGTAEFYQSAGATDAGWVKAMYLGILGRPADAAGLAYWTAQLAQGANRAAVAEGFASSVEREKQLVSDDYFNDLGRTVDAAGLAYWVNAFEHGLRNEDVVAGLLASDEYYKAHSH